MSEEVDLYQQLPVTAFFVHPNVPSLSHNASCLAEQPCRLYATKHLRVLLRASVEFFSSWGMELLVTQLHDHSKAVSMEALDILDEACEDKVTA